MSRSPPRTCGTSPQSASPPSGRTSSPGANTAPRRSTRVADFAVPRAAEPPFLLAGDAASVTRPHTASGAVKALQDALCLERSLQASSSAAEALHRYADERSPEGARLVGLGRRLGRELVENTPDWPAMGPAEVDALSRAALNGTRSYLYGSVQR
ncbi:FAD-dependent monooxygenase [Streptomyces sp. NPDC006510]|uniref:FAD-dependent monooxygenase n=1 Tax=Streptomyces sp. NPDC006510 TaxID=3155600 RepID=UPI0033AF21C7